MRCAHGVPGIYFAFYFAFFNSTGALVPFHGSPGLKENTVHAFNTYYMYVLNIYINLGPYGKFIQHLLTLS